LLASLGRADAVTDAAKIPANTAGADMTHRVAISSLVFVLLAVAPAHAQPQPQNIDAVAKARFEHGAKLFHDLQFVDALAEFAAGYELSHRPLFLFNMGECARQLGQVANARQYYTRYLAAEPNGSIAQLAHKRLDELPPDAAAKPAPAPAPAAPPSPPSPPIPTPAAAAQQVAQRPAPIPEVPRDSSSHPSWYSRWQLWAAVGVVAIAGGTTYALTRSSGCSGCVDLRN
jgi:hypothetical protein